MIAILSSTFAAYEDKQLGLYYEVVIKQFAMMKYDNEYGYIACGTPPLNVLVFFFFWTQPFLVKFKVLTRQEFNESICLILYLPYALVSTLVFIAISLASFPLAYLTSLGRLIRNLPKDPDLTEVEMLFIFLEFVVWGPIILFISIFLDVANFFTHLFTEHNHVFHIKDSHLFNLTEEGLNALEDTLDQFEQTARSQRDRVSMVEFNKQMRDNMGILDHITTLLYSHSGADKFILKPTTNQHVLNPAYLTKIKEYITLKRIVCDSAPPHLGGLVEFTLLSQFVEEVYTRKKMIEIYHKTMGETPDSEKILKNCINELTIVNPNAVQNCLGESQEAIGEMKDELDGLFERMNQLDYILRDLQTIKETYKD